METSQKEKKSGMVPKGLKSEMLRWSLLQIPLTITAWSQRVTLVRPTVAIVRSPPPKAPKLKKKKKKPSLEELLSWAENRHRPQAASMEWIGPETSKLSV